MLFRLSSFLFCQLAGGLLGWWLAGWPGEFAGAVAGSLVWLAIDLLRGARVLRWLRRGEASEAPAMRGLWGEVSDRTRRLLRNREQDTRQSESRLQEFLAAIQ